MSKYALGTDFSLPSNGSHVVVASIDLSVGTYRVSAGAYADPSNTYTVTGYDSIEFPIYVPHFTLPSRYGAEDYDLLDLGIFVLTSPGTINLEGYNEHSATTGGSLAVLIATPVTT